MTMENGKDVTAVAEAAPVEAPPTEAPPTDGVQSQDPMLARRPRGPIQLDELEKMKAENLSLKAENLAHRRQNIQDAIGALSQEEQQLKLDNTKMRDELCKKYNVDPLRMKIRRDGTLVEEPVQARPGMTGRP